MKAMTIGSIPTQQNCINWSYRNRGKVARNHTNRKQKKHVFNANTILCKLIGKVQVPRIPVESLTNTSGIK